VNILKQEISVVKYINNRPPLDLSPFTDFEWVSLKVQKKIPHIYEENTTLIAIQRIANLRATLNELVKECRVNPKSDVCDFLKKFPV